VVCAHFEKGDDDMAFYKDWICWLLEYKLLLIRKPSRIWSLKKAHVLVKANHISIGQTATKI